MKFSTEMVVLICLLLLAIAVSLMSSTSILPYSRINNFSKFEGFKENDENMDEKKSDEKKSDEKKSDEKKEKKVSDEKDEKDAKSSPTNSKKNTTLDIDSMKETFDKMAEHMENMQKNNEESMQNRLNPAPVNSYTVLDTFSLDKGSPSCEPSPYSNSKGYLCLTPEQKRLLETHGGNQSDGKDVSPSPSTYDSVLYTSYSSSV